jgi:hypothetical protein
MAELRSHALLRFELHGPARVHPNQPVRYELEKFGEAYSIEVIVRASRGYNVLGKQQTFHDDLIRLNFAGHASRFPIDLVIPPFPSHTTPLAWASLWIDVNGTVGGHTMGQRFPLHVCEPIVERSIEPAIARNQQLALGLAATRVTGGTTLVGQCSIAGSTTDTKVSLAVVCGVRTVMGAFQTMPVHTSKLLVPHHAAAAGVPFTIQLPSYLAPTLAIDTHQIQYQVEASYKQRRNRTVVSLPLHVVDAFPAPARIRPPQLGEQQIDTVFEQVAHQGGWNVGPLVDPDPELGTIMPWLYAAQDNVVMRLGYAFRPDGTTFLVSRVRYRPLELGLRVWRGRGGGTVQSGIAAWDEVHGATVRNHQHAPRAIELLSTVVPLLGPLGDVVRWDDDWLVCERPIANVERAVVDEIATTLRSVARTVAAAIRSNELPVGPYR